MQPKTALVWERSYEDDRTHTILLYNIPWPDTMTTAHYKIKVLCKQWDSCTQPVGSCDAMNSLKKW